MIDRIGKEYLTTNIEAGEYSYVQEAGSKEKLEKAVGHAVKHFKLLLPQLTLEFIKQHIWSAEHEKTK